MTLHAIRNDEILIIDANIFIYALGGKSVECEDVIRRCAAGEISGVMTPTILAETAHRLMLAEARENGWISGANPARRLAENPDKMKLLWRHEQAIHSLLGTGIHYEPIVKEDFLSAIHYEREYGFLTNDALTLAFMDRLHIRSIATADAAFSRVPRIDVFSPDDLTVP